MAKTYQVYICGKCGLQQWYTGTCADCGVGRVESFSALLKKDILEFSTTTQQHSSPVPRTFIEEFVSSLFRSSSRRSG